MLVGFAEFESQLAGERTADIKASRRERGLRYGVPRYGESSDEEGRIVEVPEEQRVLDEIVRLRERGDDGGGGPLSYQKIADRLNEREVPTKREGAQWHASSVRNLYLRRTGQGE
jgi:DNA invertase Pin-like site-specific DNA recombinase